MTQPEPTEEEIAQAMSLLKLGAAQKREMETLKRILEQVERGERKPPSKEELVQELQPHWHNQSEAFIGIQQAAKPRTATLGGMLVSIAVLLIMLIITGTIGTMVWIEFDPFLGITMGLLGLLLVMVVMVKVIKG